MKCTANTLMKLLTIKQKLTVCACVGEEKNQNTKSITFLRQFFLLYRPEG
jgi:hypothetical protein